MRLCRCRIKISNSLPCLRFSGSARRVVQCFATQSPVFWSIVCLATSAGVSSSAPKCPASSWRGLRKLKSRRSIIYFAAHQPRHVRRIRAIADEQPMLAADDPQIAKLRAGRRAIVGRSVELIAARARFRECRLRIRAKLIRPEQAAGSISSASAREYIRFPLRLTCPRGSRQCPVASRADRRRLEYQRGVPRSGACRRYQ